MKKYVVTVVVILAFILSMSAVAFEGERADSHAQVFELLPCAAQEQRTR